MAMPMATAVVGVVVPVGKIWHYRSEEEAGEAGEEYLGLGQVE